MRTWILLLLVSVTGCTTVNVSPQCEEYDSEGKCVYRYDNPRFYRWWLNEDGCDCSEEKKI